MSADDTLFERERTALRNLQLLVRDRAAREGEIAETFRVASEEVADKEALKARKQIAAARKKFVDESDAEHNANVAAINAKYEGHQRDADQKRVDLRKRTVDQYSAALEKTRDEYGHKKWAIDSILEAGEKEADDALQDAKRKAAGLTQRIEAVWEKAVPLLAKTKQTRESVTWPEEKLPAPTETDPLGRAQLHVEEAEAALERLANVFLAKLAGVKGLPVFLVLAGALSAGVGFGAIGADKIAAAAGVTAGGAIIGGLILWIVTGVLAKQKTKSLGMALGVYQTEATRSVRLLLAHADEVYARSRQQVKDKHAADMKKAADQFEPRIQGLEGQLAGTLAKIDAEHERVTGNIKTSWEADTKKENARFNKLVSETTAKLDAELAEAERRCGEKMALAVRTRDTAFDKLKNDWFGGLKAVTDTGKALVAAAARYPAWDKVAKPDYKLPEDAPKGIYYGTHDVELYALPDGMPFDHRLNLPEPLHAKFPAYLPFPQRASVLIKAKNEGRQATVNLMQAMMLRFLTGVPPGKVRFTIVDPVGLGENFAAFMHLADFDEKLVTARIWTEPGQIEDRLEDLTEHMENVIQKYLRNQYKSIQDYNDAAGEVAEPYRVLVIANFPTNFTSDAARRLVSIMQSGPACGVCVLVGMDTVAPLPRDFNPEDMAEWSYVLNYENGKFKPDDPALVPFPLAVDGPPDPKTVAEIVNKVGKASLTATRVEVPFDFIMPPVDQIWKGNASKGFEVYIGRAGATKKQAFILGKGTSQHALVAGKTGSGKSTLLHALITNLALTYSPEEAEVYLIDFKKGVEFTTYATHQLPHARVIAIESEREFGLSVLQRLDGILRERGENYRAAGVNDLAGYRAARPNEIVPRILLLVDEFQEFFTEDDKLAQEAAALMDRLVRQGRAFGVHLFLGSQTLGGAASLPRATIDQMAVRIALQSSEADAQLILSKDNTAARLLTRPGEAIYNDANGRVEGNNPFQVVYLSDERKEELLEGLHQRAEASGRRYPPPLVFEGSAAADITQNKDLAAVIAAPPDALPAGPPVFYLGDPVAIKAPTAAVLRPQSAANVLMLGQQEEGALGLMAAGLAGLAAKVRPVNNGNGAGRVFTVIDGTPDDAEFAGYLENAVNALGLGNAMVNRQGMVAALSELTAEVTKRQAGEAERTPRFLFVHGLQRLRELRKADDDFGFGKKGKEVSPGDMFVNLLREGPPQGIHCIVWCDTLVNLNRAIERTGLREFTYRVLFQMSATDSSTLLDSPVASRLGKTRAFLAEEGAERPEKFRPYGLPHGSWLRKVGEQIAAVPAAGS